MDEQRSKFGRRGRCLGFGAMLLALATACGDRENRELVRVPDERDAIEILDLLHDSLEASHLTAVKEAVKDGQKTVWEIKILDCTHDDLDRAFRDLVRSNRPRIKYPGFEEMFAGGKLIPSETEDRARYIHAKEGELQNSLLTIPGVIDVRVAIAMPKDARGAEPKDKTPASASVMLKFRDATYAKPFLDANAPAASVTPDAPFVAKTDSEFVRQSVANGVEGLDPKHVGVMVTVEGQPGVLRSGDVAAVASGSGEMPKSFLAAPEWASFVDAVERDFKSDPDGARRKLLASEAPNPGASSGGGRDLLYQVGLIALGLVAVVCIISVIKARAALRKLTRR